MDRYKLTQRSFTIATTIVIVLAIALAACGVLTLIGAIPASIMNTISLILAGLLIPFLLIALILSEM